jgi:hypothetical protein
MTLWLLLHSFIQLRTKANSTDSNLFPTAQLDPKKVKNPKTYFSKLLLWMMSTERHCLTDMAVTLKRFPKVDLEDNMVALFKNYCFNRTFQRGTIQKVWTFSRLYREAMASELEKNYFSKVF